MKSAWLPTLEISHQYFQILRAGWDMLFRASHFSEFSLPSPRGYGGNSALPCPLPGSAGNIWKHSGSHSWGVGDAGIPWVEARNA